MSAEGFGLNILKLRLKNSILLRRNSTFEIMIRKLELPLPVIVCVSQTSVHCKLISQRK